MEPKRFDLDDELSRADALWQGSSDSRLSLSVAAALAFHQVHGSAKAIHSREDFDDALNLAAAGLARLVPIYAMQDGREPEPLSIDPVKDSFVRGATQLRRSDGSLVTRLTVMRADLARAVSELKRTGLRMFVGRSTPISPRENRLLRLLPQEDYARLAPHLELVPLRSQDVLYVERAQLRYVYFPVSGVVSLLYITERGESTEIAVIGNDGAVGVAVLLGDTSSPRRAVVQIPGYAYSVRADVVLGEFHRGGALQELMLRYVQTLINQMSQTAVCNRHHTIEQQLCRWLLLSLDRVPSNEVLMTQELISQMLGVRRAGITEAARALQEAGLIRYTRGRITVPDRRRLELHACECYAAVKREESRLLEQQQR